MVEMTEAAAILRGATPCSLVLMDEIGRGTSTLDGLALAAAVAAHLHERCRAYTLFATHYFELTEFPAHHADALNVHVGAAEDGDTVVFLHEVQAGPANRSYGVQVARLAGMPGAVIRDAQRRLETLQRAQDAQRAQLDLFGTAAPDDDAPTPGAALLQRLAAVDCDTLSARDALELLYALQREAGDALRG